MRFWNVLETVYLEVHFGLAMCRMLESNRTKNQTREDLAQSLQQNIGRFCKKHALPVLISFLKTGPLHWEDCGLSWILPGDEKKLRMEAAREMLLKLYQMTSQGKPTLPFPVDPRTRSLLANSRLKMGQE